MGYKLRFADVLRYQHMMLPGLVATMRLSCMSFLLGVAVGIVGGYLKTSDKPVARRIAVAYVEFIRNTPALIQLYLVFFGLTSFGVWLDPSAAAVLTLGINCGAYATEIVRSGIEAVGKGQKEAGFSLGMSRYQVFRYVILFPTIKTVFPSLGNQFILTMLGTSVVSQIAVPELTYAASMIESRTFRSFEVYLLIAALYLALASVFAVAFWLIEKAFLDESLRLPGRRTGRVVNTVDTGLLPQ